MKKEEEKNIHAGHRARLMDTIAKVGIENVSSIQALEFVLAYIFPRGDTNPLAHRLLDKFGSFANVLDADISELCTVKGIGVRAATMITLLPDIFHLYTIAHIGKKECLSDYNRIYDYCEDLLRMAKREELYIVGLDSSFSLVGQRRLAKGSINMVGISQTDITRFFASVEPIFVFLVHNHPGGSAHASQQDIKGTASISKLFEAMGVNFIDHFIVGCDGIFSIMKNMMGREFFKIEMPI